MNAKKIFDAISLLNSKYVNETVQYPKKKTLSSIRFKAGAAAACLILTAAAAVMVHQLNRKDAVPQIEVARPAADSPAGIRKFMNYNGRRYIFMENGASYSLSEEQLKDVLGTLEYDITSDPQANAGREFSATFALGGTVYEMTGYHPDFRIAVKWNGEYYICQSAGLTDNSPMNVQEYFEAARFPETINQIAIYDHAGREMLGEFPQKETSSLISILSQVEPAALSEEDYQQIARAQREGKSYRLLLELDDGTTCSLYVIPSLDIAMIGDGRYALPESFGDNFEALFEGLEEKDYLDMQILSFQYYNPQRI